MKSLRVRLLGELQVQGRDPAQLGRRQVRTLLKVLALARGRPVGVDRLVECLWGDYPPSRPAEQVSVLVSRLRSVVGPDRVRRNDAGYSLAIDWLDLDALGAYAEEADRRLSEGAIGAARAAAAMGLSLVRGPLLADEPDPRWADADRAVADRIVARLHHAGTAAAAAAGDWTTAAQLARSVLERDPYDEVALRTAMEALARSGRSASALALYADARARMAEDLGVSLTPETETLHDDILLGALPEASLPARYEDRGPEELPGRTEAIRDLDALLERSRRGEGQVALIEGEAGIGKSRLLQSWSRRAADQGATVISVACDELGRDLPLQPLLDGISKLVTESVPGQEDVVGPELAVLGPMLGLQTEPTPPSQLAALTDPGAGQALLFAAIFSVLRRQAQTGPLVWAIDDAQFADSATTAWLALAVKRLADTAVLVLAARRPEEGVPLRGMATVTLGPLDRDATALVVGDERAAEMHARSGGNPLFLVELAAAEGDSELPASIRHAVDERCARAGAAGTMLRAGAVIGPEIDLELLAAVTGEAPKVLLDYLEEGVRRRFLVEVGQTFVFAHALVREALAAAIGASRTAYIHREVARVLETRAGADPLVVAHHARLGGELSHASAMLVTAARSAVERFDQEAALHMLDEAVRLDDTVEARLERARVTSMLGRYAQTAEDLDEARARGAGPEALEVAAWSAHFQRRLGEALRLADEGARLAADTDLRSSCLALGGWVSLASGDLAGAESRLASAGGARSESNAGLTDAWLAWLRMNQGAPEDTLRLVTHGLGRGLAAYRFPNAYALMAATMALAMLGRADEALATLDTLTSDVTRMGATRWTPRPLNLRGWIVRNLGEANKADELNHAAIDAARPLGLAEPLANSFLDLASGRLFAGDFDAAERWLDEAISTSVVEHAFRWRHELRGRLIRARLDLARSDLEGALTGAESLAGEAEALGARRCAVQAGLVAAMASHRSGAPAELATVERLLLQLEEIAGIEAWWITAEVAQVFGVVSWEELARRRVVTLLDRAGAYEGALRRAAEARLD